MEASAGRILSERAGLCRPPCRRRSEFSAALLLLLLLCCLLAAAAPAGAAKLAKPAKPTAKAPIGAVTSATPTFMWNKASRAATYELRVYRGSTQLIKKTGLTKRSWTSATALPTAQSLTWKVRAKNARGFGPWSRSLAFTVAAAPSSAKALISFSFAVPAATGVINESLHTVAVSVPFGTNVAALVASFTTTGTSVAIAGTPQVSGVTVVNFNNPVTYTVTAADASTQSYLVTVTVASASAKAITAFSFAVPAAAGVINESLHTIAVSVPFGTTVGALVASFTTTGASVRVGATPQVSGTTANNFSGPVTYTVVAADASAQAYMVTVTVAAPGPSSAKAITAFSFSSPAASGVINEADHTIAVSVPSGTSVTALVPAITISGASVSPASGAARNFTSPVTYTVTAADSSTQAYLVTVTVAAPGPSSAKAITAFSFASPAATGVINETLHTIAVSVPSGTNVTALVPTIAISGASLSPLSGVARNFTSPVTYTVTAADASTQAYVVTVTVAAPGPSSAKAITAFTFEKQAAIGVINESLHTIAVTVPDGTDVSNLAPTITISGERIDPGSGGPQDFTSPVTYTVTAADSSTQEYVVTVTLAASASAKAITAFSFASPAATGVIEGTDIAVTVPFGTNVTALVPTIAITGSSISPASGVAQNFTNRVVYTVTAADASTQKYGVTVTVAPPPPSSNKAITAFSFASPAAAGVVNETLHVILVTVPYGTNVTALVPSITISGASVSPLSEVAQDFTSPVTYTVTAADSSTQAYLVGVTAPLVIGSTYGGGKVAYILMPGDPGYVAGETHGLIAAAADQSAGIPWALTAYQGTAVPGGTYTALGTGSANTDHIIAQNGAGSTYAAGLARAYRGGGYSDWFLPSKDELDKLCVNRGALGGFETATRPIYWSSSEQTNANTWVQYFNDGAIGGIYKSPPARVRAVRAF